MDSQQNDSHPSNTVSVELPPDQALRIVINKVSGSFLLLSVSDDPIYFGKGSQYEDFSSFSDVQIFSESIAFVGDLVSQPGVSISCNQVAINVPIDINATGAPGADQVIGVSEAQTGGNGGLINFYVQSGSVEVSKHLSFVADGGRGGDVVVEGARGGDGGNGGLSVRIFQSLYSILLGSIYEFLDRKDASEENFESPVDKNDPICLSAYQLLSVAASVITQDQEGAFERVEALRKQLVDIESGIAYKVWDVVLTVRFVRNSVEDLVDKQKDGFGVAASVAGGYPGSGKDVQGVTGLKGKDGSDTYLFLSTYNSDISKTTFAFAHPEQCTMLLDRAKIFYYMGSPQLRVLAGNLFQRLVNRLNFLPADPSPTESAIKSADSSKLESIKTEAANWLIQLKTGVSFAGHPDNWVPRTSYTFYDGQLDTALADHAAFENAYIQYHAALAEQEELTASVALALQQTSQMLSSLKIQIDDLVKKLLATESLVISLTEPVKSTHAVLLQTFEELQDRIRNDFELSLPQLMNALKSVAFSTTGKFASEVINLVYEGFTSVPNINCTPANQNYLISKIKLGEATVKSFKTELGTELDGEFKLDDPFGTRLMVAEEDMMNFLEAYANSSFADVIEEMKTKFDAFVDAVVKRNEQAVLYNLQLKVYVGTVESKEEYEQKEKDLRGKQIEANDPDLPIITEYMGDIYQSSRARVMQLLDNLVRSLTFRMLKSYDIYELAFQGTDSAKDRVPLTITSDVLRSGRSRIQSEFGKQVEIWGSEPARFPPNFDNPRGKRIYLSDTDRDHLIKNHRVELTIPVVEKDTIQKNDFSGCCNVRIYRVRFGLTGLATDKLEAFVSVTLTHSGNEIIMDRENLRHTFEHDPISTKYEFNLYPNGSIEVGDNGNIAEANVDETATSYAAPGPFPSQWTVDLRDSQLDNLDFSNVTDAYFDFCGTNYAFPTK